MVQAVQSGELESVLGESQIRQCRAPGEGGVERITLERDAGVELSQGRRGRERRQRMRLFQALHMVQRQPFQWKSGQGCEALDMRTAADVQMPEPVERREAVQIAQSVVVQHDELARGVRSETGPQFRLLDVSDEMKQPPTAE